MGGVFPLQKKKSFASDGSSSSPTGSGRGDHGFMPLAQTEKKPSFAGRGVSGGNAGGGMDQAAAVAASGGGVKKGAAGSFDPSLLSSGAMGSSSREKGFFVARDDDQKQIDIIDKVLLFSFSVVVVHLHVYNHA